MFSKKEQAVLNFVSKATLNSLSVIDEDVKQLKIYFSEAQVIEILFFVSYMLTTNTIINTLDIELPEGL
ncbi:MAG: carboxymuconolactone decarboxylase family protein [Bacilli bacterium]